MSRFPVALVLVLAVVAAGCSSSNSPTSPSAPVPSATATITGSVLGSSGGSGGGSTGSESAGGDIIVSIVGTELSVKVDSARRFSLSRVPGGDVQLRVTGPGFAGLVTVKNVTDGEKIDLTLQVQGAGVTVESEQRESGDDGQTGNDQQIQGAVESIGPGGSLVVNGISIATDAKTEVIMGSQALTLAALAVGQNVHVTASLVGGSLIARRIEIFDDSTAEPVRLAGTASAVSGSSSSFSFQVGSVLVNGDDTTEFGEGSTFADLVDGATVEVAGLQRNGFVQAGRIVVVDDGGLTISWSGAISAFSGTPPDLTLTVGGRLFLTNSQTEVRRRDVLVNLTELQSGMQVSIEAVGQDSGPALATKIVIESDGRVDDRAGVMVAVSGTCPNLVLSTGEKTIYTDSLTEFSGITCGTITAGMTLHTFGYVQADGRIYAFRVTTGD